MDLKKILPLVAPQHRREFRRFVRTGNASRRFCRYLDRSDRCQRETASSILGSFCICPALGGPPWGMAVDT